MYVIYDKTSGMILNSISDNVNPNILYINFGDEFVNNLTSLEVKNISGELSNYYVNNSELVEFKNDMEKYELNKYNRFLTDKERLKIKLNNELIPSKSEISKAENTIKILELLSEVL